jgi:hypothetical protein
MKPAIREPVKQELFIVLTQKRLEKYFFPLGRGLVTQEKKDELAAFNKVLKAVNTGHKYICLSQDEPYADKVWKVILDGEKEKQLAISPNKKSCGTCGGFTLVDGDTGTGDCQVMRLPKKAFFTHKDTDGCIQWRK